MKTTDKSADIEQIACGVCLKEVPISEAIVAGGDGLRCAFLWLGLL